MAVFIWGLILSHLVTYLFGVLTGILAGAMIIRKWFWPQVSPSTPVLATTIAPPPPPSWAPPPAVPPADLPPPLTAAADEQEADGDYESRRAFWNMANERGQLAWLSDTDQEFVRQWFLQASFRGLAEFAYVTPVGKCYHLTKHCLGMMKAIPENISERRLCNHCRKLLRHSEWLRSNHLRWQKENKKSD